MARNVALVRHRIHPLGHEVTRHQFDLENQPAVVLTLLAELVNVCALDREAWDRVNKEHPLTYDDTTATDSRLHWWEYADDRRYVRSIQQTRIIPAWLWELVHTEGLPDPIKAIRDDPSYPLSTEHTQPEHDDTDEPPTTIRRR